MKMYGNYVLAGAIMKPNYRDPSQTTPKVLLREIDGLDTVECSTNEDIYKKATSLPEFSKVHCYLDYNTTFKNLRVLDVNVDKPLPANK